MLCLRLPNACVSDRRQREAVSGVKPGVEAASCSLDAMVRRLFCSGKLLVPDCQSEGNALPQGQAGE